MARPYADFLNGSADIFDPNHRSRGWPIAGLGWTILPMDCVASGATKAGSAIAPSLPAVPMLVDETDRERAVASVALRAQAALVRSLAHEINRRSSTDAHMAPLHEQLDEETERLGRYVRLAAARC
jgi:hypothetical protein